jgi:hypothetical protein
MRLELRRRADGAVVGIDQDHPFRRIVHRLTYPAAA